MQVPQRRQRDSLNLGKLFSSSSIAPNGHSTVQRLHWVQPSKPHRRKTQVAGTGMGGTAKLGILQRLDGLQVAPVASSRACTMSMGRRTGPAV